MSILDERVNREKENYDNGTVFEESSKLHDRFVHVFWCKNTMKMEEKYRNKIKEHSFDKDILDYGCYDGWMIPEYQKYNPRKIVGIDISEKGITEARRAHPGIDFIVGDAHKTDFEDNSFDLVVGRAILHHLDWVVALREIRRILKPGGHAVFIEPLGDNPGAKLIRALTPKARTKDETPLSRGMIREADQIFGSSNHHFANLLSVPVALVTSLTMKSADNAPLYLADAVDRAVARTPLRYWMRSVVLDWKKVDGK